MTNQTTVEIVDLATDEVVSSFPAHKHQVERVIRGASINLDHTKYFVREKAATRTYIIVAKIETDRTTCEARRYDDDTYTLWWTDGPREGEDTMTRSEVFAAVAEAATEELTV